VDEYQQVYGTVQLTPEVIREMRFPAAHGAGYDPGSVHEFLFQVAGALEVLHANDVVQAMRRELQRNTEISSRMVLAGQETAERLREQAASDARSILEDTRQLAEQMRDAARAEVEQSRAHIEHMRATFTGELRDMYDRIGATLYRFESAHRHAPNSPEAVQAAWGQPATAPAPAAGDPYAYASGQPAADPYATAGYDAEPAAQAHQADPYDDSPHASRWGGAQPPYAVPSGHETQAPPVALPTFGAGEHASSQAQGLADDPYDTQLPQPVPATWSYPDAFGEHAVVEPAAGTESAEDAAARQTKLQPAWTLLQEATWSTPEQTDAVDAAAARADAVAESAPVEDAWLTPDDSPAEATDTSASWLAVPEQTPSDAVSVAPPGDASAPEVGSLESGADDSGYTPTPTDAPGMQPPETSDALEEVQGPASDSPSGAGPTPPTDQEAQSSAGASSWLDDLPAAEPIPEPEPALASDVEAPTPSGETPAPAEAEAEDEPLAPDEPLVDLRAMHEAHDAQAAAGDGSDAATSATDEPAGVWIGPESLAEASEAVAPEPAGESDMGGWLSADPEPPAGTETASRPPSDDARAEALISGMDEAQHSDASADPPQAGEAAPAPDFSATETEGTDDAALLRHFVLQAIHEGQPRDAVHEYLRQHFSVADPEPLVTAILEDAASAHDDAP
jgi:hypothetical protein